MPSLIIHSRDGHRTPVELSERPIKLGRAEHCDVVLRDDGEVSREHAEIWLDPHGRVLVADRDSKNGTRVDDGEVFRGATRIACRSITVGEHFIDVLDASSSGGGDAYPTVTFTPDSPARMGDTHFFPSSKRLDLNQHRLALLMSLAERIGGTFVRRDLLEQALDACCEALGFERALIVLKTPRGEPELPVSRNVQRDETGAFKVSRTLINRALINGERAVVNNPATDLVGNITESLVRFPICSALCVPILHRDEVLGVIYGDRVTQAAAYKAPDVDFLAAIAQQVGVGLANLRLFEEHLRFQKVYTALEQARDIQRNLLPKAPLRTGFLRLEGYNEPSSAVSGDYFDYYELSSDRVGFIIADVTGHGLPASLMMANLQAAIQVALSGAEELPHVAARVNRLVCRNTESHVFITAILGTIDRGSGVIEYVNAGHPPPLLLGQRVRAAAETGGSLPFGIDVAESYSSAQLELDDASALLLYTDGLIEAARPDGPILGLPPVIDALHSLSERSTGAIIRCALSLVRRHLAGVPNADDLTLLAMQLSKSDTG